MTGRQKKNRKFGISPDSVKYSSPTKLCDDAQMAISKFAQGPHHVWSMVDIQSAAAEIKRGIKKEKKKKKETTGQKYNGLPYSIGRP